MHDRIIGLYEENAAAWADARSTGGEMERSWLDRFTARLPAGASILDVGCGNGYPIADYLAKRGFQITGVDSSPSLLKMAQESLPGHQWVVSDMRQLDLRRRFDGVIAWHSFFHLNPDDQPPMFPRFAAHANSGGMLMFTSGPVRGESIGEWQGEPLYHGSLSPEEYRELLAANNFELLANVIQDSSCGGATVWLARKQA